MIEKENLIKLKMLKTFCNEFIEDISDDYDIFKSEYRFYKNKKDYFIYLYLDYGMVEHQHIKITLFTLNQFALKDLKPDTLFGFSEFETFEDFLPFYCYGYSIYEQERNKLIRSKENNPNLIAFSTLSELNNDEKLYVELI